MDADGDDDEEDRHAEGQEDGASSASERPRPFGVLTPAGGIAYPVANPCAGDAADDDHGDVQRPSHDVLLFRDARSPEKRRPCASPARPRSTPRR